MTLVEVVVAVGVGSVVLAAVTLGSLFTARSFAAMGNYMDLDRASRNTLDTLSRDVRQAVHLSSYSTNQIVLSNLDGTLLTYTYSPGAATLTRTQGGTNNILLKQCDYLNFDFSQRNPSNNFTFYPATPSAPPKLIDVSWKCSRQIFGKKVNTESVQTAKVVIRN